MPVNQVTAQLQVLPNLSFAAFYQLEWRESRAPAVGSYQSDLDVFDDGGDRLWVVPGVVGFNKLHDQEASDSGQWGLSTRFRIPGLDADFGIHYYQFHEKAPQIYAYPVLGLGAYRVVFPENIEVLGMSVGSQIGDVNVSGEAHMRWNMPLQSDPMAMAVIGPMVANNSHHPLYATGDTGHAQISTVYIMGPSCLWQGATSLAEVGVERVMDYRKNRAALNPDKTRDAWGFRTVFEANYYQVLNGLDLIIPLGLGYNPKGKSSVQAKFNGGANEGGDFSVGITGIYRNAWKASLNYTNFFGSGSTQAVTDRDFVTFSIQRTF